MKQPIEVSIDFEADAGYVRYSTAKFSQNLDVWADGQVEADLDASGGVIGIEVLGFDEETLGHARAYAERMDLAFPENLPQASKT